MAKKYSGLLILLFLCSVAFGQNSVPADSLNVAIDATVENVVTQATPDIIPNQGFTITTLLRGALGMAVLILISFLFSANRRAINWKTVGIGLGIQLLLAIGILKITVIRQFFTVLGMLFNEILNFTLAGSEFILGPNLLNVDNPNIGYVFAFQILPTIIFFSALTSVLFYLGIIQKIVQGLAWLLTKSLGISGTPNDKGLS
jgi:CNT family concentrative nucleoside transporter